MFAGQILNQDIPHGDVPIRPMGRIPVIAHLVTAAGEQLRPGLAIRWTRTHVMVCIEDHTERKIRADYLWLRAADVTRIVHVPPP